jgi:hypothetical protein
MDGLVGTAGNLVVLRVVHLLSDTPNKVEQNGCISS